MHEKEEHFNEEKHLNHMEEAHRLGLEIGMYCFMRNDAIAFDVPIQRFIEQWKRDGTREYIPKSI
jgi:hypothetical protein